MKERRKKISVFTLMLGALLGMLFGFSMPTQAAYSGGTQSLTSSNGGSKVLYSNVVYTVTSNTEIRGNSSSNGYYLPSSSTVATIYIKPGVTLSVYGGNASGSTSGKAGIKVGSGQSLVIIGGGTLKVYGGNGGNGASGTDKNGHHKHDGGSGGAGGAGGGAAIGTDGASGGDGGAWRCVKSSRGDGRPGGNGGTASSCGTIYIVGSVTRSTNSTGSNGSGGGTQKTTDRGGSGGGGGGGQGAVAIGTGGAGGGGGGGGATGKDRKLATDKAGGGGSAGASWGSSASAGKKGSGSVEYTGGSGGNRGTSSRTATVYTDINKASTNLQQQLQITVKMNLGIDVSDSTNTGTAQQTTLGTTEQSFYYGASSVRDVQIPKRLGYVFEGYYTGKNGSGDKIYNADGTVNSGYLKEKSYLDDNYTWTYPYDLTVYANWVPLTAQITLNANGGSGSMTVAQKYDENINPWTNYVPRRVGYVFDGYYTGKTDGVQIFDKDMNYQKFSADKGDVAGNHLTGVGVGSTSTDIKEGILSQFYKDVTLYAHWHPVKYKIHYYSWSEEEQENVFIKEVDATYGKMTFLSNDDLDITRDHHTFSGWNTYTEQGWNMYKANHEYSGGLTEIENEIVPLYAVWEPVGQVTITYKAEGGSGVPVDGVAYNGEKYDIAEKEPTRENYTFVGWNTASDGSGDYYKAGASDGDEIDGKPVKSNLMAGSSNIILYAIWKADPTLTYNVNGGSGYIPMEYHKGGKSVALLGSENNKENLPTKEGYTLVGWKTEKDSENYMPLTQIYIMPDKDTVLYAAWKVEELSVEKGTFTDAQGEDVKGDIVGWNSEDKKEESLVKTVNYNQSYTFAVKLDNHYSTSNMTVSVSGMPVVRSSKVEGTGEAEGYTYYIYKVNSPRVKQTIDVTGIDVSSYTVSLIANGGTVDTLTSYTYGKKTNLPTPKKTGYTFEGWFTDKEFTEPADNEESEEGETVYYIAENADGNKVFYAKWKELEYKVTYEANGGTFAEGTATKQDFRYDETKKLLTFEDSELTAPEGATGLLGWALDENAETPDYVDGQYVTNLTTEKDLTLYAVWDIPKYVISYDLNGGSMTEAMNVVTVNNGKDYKLSFDEENIPTKQGYTFAGWSDGTTTYTNENNKVRVTQNLTLTAQWEANEYTVKFDGNGGSGEMEPQEFVYDASQQLKANIFTHDDADGKNYYFQGWSLEAEGEVLYVDEEEVQNLTAKNQDEITLYAIWGTEEKVYVSYDANGGVWENKIPSAVEATNETAELSVDEQPQRTGYTFTGWADSKDAESADYVEGSLTKVNVIESTTVYAVWKKNTYTVKFDSNADSETVTGDMADLTDVGYGDKVSLTANAFIREGFVFAGWAASAEGNAIYRDGQKVQNLTAEDKGEVTLYAVWKETGQVTILFDAVGGEQNNSATVTTGSDVDLSETTYKEFEPKKEGYKFAGWSTEYNNEDKIVTKLNNVTSTIVLYAVWTQQEGHSVNYTVDGTEYLTDSAIYYEGSTVNINFDSTPEKTGYVFAGWSDGKTIYIKDETATLIMPGNDVTLEAQWTPIAYTVRFDKNSNKASGAMDNLENVVFDKEFTLPSNSYTAPNGYAFAGWSTQKGSIVADYADKDTVKDNLCEHNGDTITLYAVWKAAEVKIHFNNDAENVTGGTTEETVTYGQPLPVLTSIPSRQNYTFKGYYTQKDGKGKQYYDANLSAVVTESTLTEDITLYANWSVDKYRIVYQDADGVELKTYQVAFKQDVVIQSANAVGLAIKDGQKVVWQKNGNEDDTLQVNQKINGGFFTEDEKIGTVYLKANVRLDTQYEVTYNANGGGFSEVPAPQLVWDGDKTEVQYENVPSKDGYDFIGWMMTTRQNDNNVTVKYYTDAYLKKHPEVTRANRIFVVNRATVLYAMWEPGQYTITYDGNGGNLIQGKADQQILVRGAAGSHVYDAIYERKGYEFVGWATSKKGSAQYEAEETIQTDIAPATQTKITLYAVWNASSYTVDFRESETGAIIKDADAIEAIYDKSYGTLPVVTRTGYVFSGWYKGSYDEASKTFTRGQKVTAATSVTDAKDHSLYAVWDAKTDTPYTVKHLKQQVDDENSYTQADSEQLTGTTNSETAAKAKTYTGFTAQKVTQKKIDARGNTVIEIKYDRNHMGITYPTGENAVEGLDFEMQENPAYVLYDGNYTFTVLVDSGWDDNTVVVRANGVVVPSSATEETEDGIKITYTVRNATKDQIITASVKPIVTDTFNANGGTFADGKDITTYSGKSGEVIEFKAPEREGYRFAGWAESAYAKTGSSTVKFKGGITYYAVWEHDENTYVKFIADDATINGARFVVVNSKGQHAGTLYDAELPTATHNDSQEVNHHEFKHWALENKYDATKVTKDLIFRENTDVYAIWTYVIGNTADGSKIIIDDDFTLNADGSVTGKGIGENNKLTIVDKDGNKTELKLPEGNSYTVAENGNITLTGEGNTVTRPNGDKITTNGAATVTTDGTITLTEEGSSAIVKKANGEEITVDSKDSTIKADETITSKKPITVKKDNQTNIIIPGNAADSITGIDADGKVNPGNATVTPKGDYTIESDNTVSLGEAGGKVTLPNGKEADINGDAKVSGDGNITAPKGTTVAVDNKEIEGPAAVSKDGMTAEVEPASTDGKGKITGVDKDTQYSTDGGNSWNTAQPDGNGGYVIPDVSGDVIIRNGEDNNTRTTISIGTKDAPAPINKDNIKADKATSADAKDSTITGVDSSMEYSTDGGKTWNDVTGNEITGLGSGEVLIRTKETRTEVAGEAVTITIEIKATPAPIKAETIKSTKATTANAKDARIIGVDTSMEYSTDGGKTWKQVTGNTIDGLGAGEVQIRVKGTENANPSEAIQVMVGVKTTPAPIKAGTIKSTKTTTANAKDAKIIGVNSSMEYSTDGGKTWKQVTGNTINGLGVGEVQIRVKGTEDANPSRVTKVMIGVKDKANAPSAARIKVKDADSKKIRNAVITGVNSSMEYSRDGGRTWIKVTGNRITGLGVGQVQIRYAESGTRKASAATTITIGIKAQTAAQKKRNKLALNSGLKVSQSGKAITIKWGKLAEADGYDVYAQYCGKKFRKVTATVTSGKISSVRIKKLNGKKLNLKANYKVYVSAYTVVNGKKITLCKSIAAHVVGIKNKKYTNARNIRVNKSKITLKKGKTAKIKAKTILVNKRKKQLGNKHASQFRYVSSDANIANVNRKGKITAKKKGTCTIYVYARNGFAKKIKVTVR